MTSIDLTDEVIARTVAAVLHHLARADTAAPDEPEFLPDNQIRRKFFGNENASTYWRRTKDDLTFPSPVQVGRTKLRKVAEIRAWLAAREVA